MTLAKTDKRRGEPKERRVSIRIRVKPSVKAMAERLAQKDARSMADWLEQLMQPRQGTDAPEEERIEAKRSRVKRFANAEDFVLSMREITTHSELYKYQKIIDELDGESAATRDFLAEQLTDPQEAPQLKLDILANFYRAIDRSMPISRAFVSVNYYSVLSSWQHLL